jgi:hypothetical protein
MIILNRQLSVDGKQDLDYRTLQTMVIVGRIASPSEAWSSNSSRHRLSLL